IDVAAHAVKAVIVEFLQQSFIAQGAVGSDGEGPDISLHALVDVKDLAIRAEIDAVGGPHAGSREGYFAGSVDAPDLASGLGTVRIAGIEGAVRSDGQVIGLVHLLFVSEDGDLARFRIDTQDVVADIIGDVHEALLVEDDAVADALPRQGDKNLALTIGRDL